MKIRPVNDRILVHPFKAPDKSAGGLWIPDQAQGEVQVGIVSAVGPGRGFEGPGHSVTSDSATGAMLRVTTHARAPLQAQPGDIVSFGKYSGAKVQVGASELFLLREDELLAIMEELPDEWIVLNKDAIEAAKGGGNIDMTALASLEVSPRVEADLEGRPFDEDGQGVGAAHAADVVDEGSEPPPIRRIVEP